MIKVITKEEYRVSEWSGGKTIQLAIAPEGADYADRDFLWRVSSATVELKESDYTSLPDYNRLITPLGGEMFLTHDGGEEIEVVPFEVHEFDGASATHCRGVCTDFNLMTRKGQAQGMMTVIDVDSENSVILNPVTEEQSMLLYLVEGEAVLCSGEKEYMIRKGESLFLTDESEACELESDDYAVFAAAFAEIL